MSFSALLEGIELLAGIVMTQQQIQIEAIKSKINSLVSQHQDEFKAINDINKLFLTLQSQSVLSQSLSNLSDQILLTWNILAKDIDEKVKLEQRLTSDYKDVLKSNQSFTLNDGLFLSFGAISSAYKLYSLQKTLSSIKADTPQKCIKQMKGAFMKDKIIVQRINIVDEGEFKPKEGESQLEWKQMKKPKGSIQSTSQVQVSQRLQSALQAPIQSSLWSKVKSFGSSIGKKLLKGLNAIGFLAMMYGIYTQHKAIDSLLSQLKKMNDQYGDSGHFKVTEVEIINLLITSAQLMSNLSYASYSTVLLIKNSYMLMAITQTNLNGFLLDKAQNIKPENYSVGIDFCQASNKLYKTLNSIQVDDHSSNQIMKSALQKSRDLLKDYMIKWNPMLVFTNLAKQIGDFSIQNSIFLKKQLISQTYYSDFDRQILQMFDDRKKNIMKYDQILVINICSAYLRFLSQFYPDNKYDSFILQYDQIFTIISSDHLKVIGNIIASFTNLIFSQSINGDILFKKKISDYKTNQRFGDDLTKFNSIINTIPIPFSKLQEQNQVIQEIKKQVLKVIKNHPEKKLNVYSNDYYIIDTYPVIFWKENKEAMIINGQHVSKIQFKKGIIYKVMDQATHTTKLIQFNDAGSSWQGKILDH